jgi:predicted DNA-binding protein (UPF0278 family)
MTASRPARDYRKLKQKTIIEQVKRELRTQDHGIAVKSRSQLRSLCRYALVDSRPDYQVVIGA